jgi:hypothetical protein
MLESNSAVDKLTALFCVGISPCRSEDEHEPWLLRALIREGSVKPI